MSRLFAVLFLLEIRQGAACPFLPSKKSGKEGCVGVAGCGSSERFGICQIFYKTFTAL
jgi:hypothetical protein